MSKVNVSAEEIHKYLQFKGIDVLQTSHNSQYITAEATIAQWEEMFGNEFHLYQQSDLNDAHIIRAEEYSLPDILLDHVESVFNVVQFPGRKAFKNSISSAVVLTASSEGYVTPALINSFYSIRNNSGNSYASQAVVELNDETLSTADLARFQKEFKVPQKAIASNTGGHVVNTACVDGTSCSEANLDVQYLMAVSQTTPTSFMYWNGTDFWLDWITSVAAMTNPPLVISISYVQNEHDVSQSYADAFNFEAMKLSLAGVTLVVASGDDGVAGLDARQDVMRCGFFPQFPATSPYVTSIGATQGPESGSAEVACQSDSGGAITSGGGFSTLFKAPAWQMTAVSGFTSQYCTDSPTLLPSGCPSTSSSVTPSRSPSLSPST
eukprot:gene35342-43575_t